MLDADDGWMNHGEAMWVRQGREDRQISRMSVQKDGSLFLSNLDHDDSGVYLCMVEDEIRMKVKLEVRGMVKLCRVAVMCKFFLFLSDFYLT